MLGKILYTSLVVLFIVQSTTSLYSSTSNVIKLTSKNFKSTVLQSGELWFVQFYAPWCGHCKNFAPEYQKAANALKGIVHVGAVDMTTDQSVGQPYGVQGFPTVKFFPGSKTAQDYNGDRTAKAMISFSMKQAKDLIKNRLDGKIPVSNNSQKKTKEEKKSDEKKKADDKKEEKKFKSSSSQDPGDKDVVVLNDQNFASTVYESNEPWLVEFYAPWCGHCKALAPEWNKAATKLKGAVKVAKVDATQNNQLSNTFGVQGYPTIKFFKPGAQKKASWAQEYTGGRNEEGIVNWVNNKLMEYNYVPQIDQFVSEKEFNQHCKGENKICIIAFLPHIYDSDKKTRDQNIAFLKKVAGKNRGTADIMWAQGGDHLNFERELRLQFGYPAVVGISLNKQRYAIMKGQFTEFKVSAFVTGLLYGKESLLDFPKEVPKIQNVDKWDGNDATPPVEEPQQASQEEGGAEAGGTGGAETGGTQGAETGGAAEENPSTNQQEPVVAGDKEQNASQNAQQNEQNSNEEECTGEQCNEEEEQEQEECKGEECNNESQEEYEDDQETVVVQDL